jgi:glycerol-3-phosphate acyltransferase PlsX
MIIAVDAMGGDAAPHQVVRGACLALERSSARILLIGDEDKIHRCLSGGPHPPALDILHAPHAVGMEEIGPLALRKKKPSSLSVAIQQLAQGSVDAVVSAGNSAAIVATATHALGLLQGLKRPALAAAVPSLHGHVLLADAGAHTQSNTLHLAQTLCLIISYLRQGFGTEHPRVGLLNVGRESTKGPKAIRDAAALLTQASVPFEGFVEPHEIFSGEVDAVVCDGFLGNALLKLLEGVGEALRVSRTAAADGRDGGWTTRLAGAELSAVPLLGLGKPVLVAHGRSRAKEMANAVLEAENLVKSAVVQKMAEDTELIERLSALRSQDALWRLGRWSRRWRKTLSKAETDKGGGP